MRKFGIGLMAASLAWLSAPVPSHAAQVFTQDLIVQGSTCTGVDCTNSESFGFDTLRLKENNLRIKFDDTSTSGGFPSNDWQLTANDSGNGGSNYFAIDDITSSKQPFRIDAGAGNNALRVYSNGNVGIGAGDTNQGIELHIKDGDSPTLRLEQDGSAGFTAQTWDLAGNETNFFVRDVTSGSHLPLRIFPGSGNDDALVITADGDIGMGTDSPAAATSLQIVANTGTGDDVVAMVNNGPTRFLLENTASTGNSIDWRFNHANNGALRIAADDGDVEFDLDQDGNLMITGEITTASGTSPFPDYVFEEDYALMPLSDLESFVKENGHLPNIPSQGDINGQGGKINMTEMQLKLLEKVEELTLYTLEQEKTINELHERLAALE